MIEISTGLVSMVVALMGQFVIVVWFLASLSARINRVEEILHEIAKAERTDHDMFKASFSDINRKLDNHELRLQHIEDHK
jgi:ABC-type uncharacterized transport system fused permease/ATPase subunit